MSFEFNANIKLLMGGNYRGAFEWNKKASDIDHCYKIYHVIEGRVELQTEGCSVFLNPGKSYFINGYMLGAQRCLEELHILWLHFQPQSGYLDHLLKQTPCAIELDSSERNSFPHQLKQAEVFFDSKNRETDRGMLQLELIALVHLAIASVFRKMGSSLVREEKVISRLVPALDLITKKFNEPLNLKELAEACCLSPNYFHRLFSGAFKMSPLYYIRIVRLEEAIRQLVYTMKPVKQVAWDTGFEDESYFSRIFSRTYGISPGRYRKENSMQGP